MSNLLMTIPLIAENFQWRDALDIVIVGFLIYGFLLLLQRTHSRFIINGISILLGIYFVARYFDLYLTSILFQTFFTFLVVILVVIFQKELRNFFEWIYIWGRFFPQKTASYSESITDQIIDASHQLAQKHIGALMILPGKQMIDMLTQGGIGLHGRLSVSLLLSIFDPSSPGHDGAIIIEGDRVKKFGVHLPLAERFDPEGGFGTRHRAALGLAERSDALVIVISEEKGTISVAHEGRLKTLHRSDELKEFIRESLQEKHLSRSPEKSRWYSLLTHNIREKILAGAFTLLFWYMFVVQLGTGVLSHDYEVPVEFRFLPQEYIISKQSTDTIIVTLSGRNQDFSLFAPTQMRVVVNLPEAKAGYQRVRIDTSMISHPASLSVIKFTPGFVDFTVGTAPAAGKAK